MPIGYTDNTIPHAIIHDACGDRIDIAIRFDADGELRFVMNGDIRYLRRANVRELRKVLKPGAQR